MVSPTPWLRLSPGKRPDSTPSRSWASQPSPARAARQGLGEGGGGDRRPICAPSPPWLPAVSTSASAGPGKGRGSRSRKRRARGLPGGLAGAAGAGGEGGAQQAAWAPVCMRKAFGAGPSRKRTPESPVLGERATLTRGIPCGGAAGEWGPPPPWDPALRSRGRPPWRPAAWALPTFGRMSEGGAWPRPPGHEHQRSSV